VRCCATWAWTHAFKPAIKLGTAARGSRVRFVPRFRKGLFQQATESYAILKSFYEAPFRSDLASNRVLSGRPAVSKKFAGKIYAVKPRVGARYRRPELAHDGYMTANITRAVAYVRVSMARDDAISPELQMAAITQHCRRCGYQLATVLEDFDLSGWGLARTPV